MTTETVLTVGNLKFLYSAYLEEYCLLPTESDEVVRAIERAVLQSPEVQALRKDADLYRGMKSICVTSTDFTGEMQPDETERWCVLRRKDGIISSFSGDDLDHGINAAMEQKK